MRALCILIVQDFVRIYDRVYLTVKIFVLLVVLSSFASELLFSFTACLPLLRRLDAQPTVRPRKMQKTRQTMTRQMQKLMNPRQYPHWRVSTTRASASL